MIRLLFAKEGDEVFKQRLGKWVMERVFMVQRLRPGDYEVIGVARIDPANQRSEVIAGLLFHNYCAMGDGGKIEITMAAEDPRWAMPGVIRALLSYPFRQLKCHIVVCMTNRTNKRTRKFLEGIGFEERGTVPNRPYADDTVIYVLRVETAIKKGWIEEVKAA